MQGNEGGKKMKFHPFFFSFSFPFSFSSFVPPLQTFAKKKKKKKKKGGGGRKKKKKKGGGGGVVWGMGYRVKKELVI